MAHTDNQFSVIFHDVENNQELSFPLDPNQQISEIYDLFDKQNVKEHDQYYLAYNGNVLHRRWTVKKSDIPNGAIIDICSRQFIMVTFVGSNVTFTGDKEIGANLSTDVFIGDLKEQLSHLVNQNAQNLHIYWNSQELNDESTFISLGIFANTTMTIKYEEPPPVPKEEQITVVVAFLGQKHALNLPVSTTMNQIFGKCKAILGNVTVLDYYAKYNGIPQDSRKTLKDIGVSNMDTLDFEIIISGG